MARNTPGGVAGDRLQLFINRIERLDEEIALLKQDRKDILTEAKSAGFEPKIINAIVSERKKDPAAVEEFEVLKEVYKAAIGMLRGTPLGDAARRRLMGDRRAAKDDGEGGAPSPESGADDADPEDGGDAPPPAPEASEEDLIRARAEGAAAAKADKPVTDNPYPAPDARRAAWDEGWCAAAGSDGMDIPPAFRRAKQDKGRKPGADGAAGAAN
jgi:uncharacterized protein (UPF0335 family)